jgi:hypothetical protein
MKLVTTRTAVLYGYGAPGAQPSSTLELIQCTNIVHWVSPDSEMTPWGTLSNVRLHLGGLLWNRFTVLFFLSLLAVTCP